MTTIHRRDASDFLKIALKTFALCFGLSANAGTSWSAADSGPTDKNINVLKGFAMALFAGTDQGLYRSVNGRSWSIVEKA